MAGIVNGLFAGRAGIESHGSAISVLADNISNSNTVGFKASRADFADLLSSSLGGGGSSITVGSGSTLEKVTTIFSQGTFEFTGRGLDVAIDGNGFYVLDNNGTRVYSRAGNFSVDSAGVLRNQNGYKVLGFPANGAGGLQELNVNEISQSSVASTQLNIAGNLDAGSDITAVPGGSPSFATLAQAATFSTFADVFDSLGAKHTVTVYFFHTNAGTWQASAYADSGEIAGGGAAGSPVLLDTTSIAFNSDGSRTSLPTTVAPDLTLTPNWSSGASTANIGVLLTPFTQFSTNSAVTAISQDGSGTGSVTSFSVEKDGSLFALLDNGQSSVIGTVALANFASPEGLRRFGGSTYINSTESGEPIIGKPNTGQFGKTQSGALELSTSDIAADFVKLISLQRGFQGSSRMISSINSLLDEIIRIAQ